MASFAHRLMGAAALDAATYEEVEADGTSGVQAMAVVLLSAVAAGIGARGFGGSLSAVPAMMVLALLSWAAWAVLTYHIGAQLLPEPETSVNVNQLLRTLGFAATPGLLLALGAVPGLTTPVFILALAWMLAAMVVAIRQALDYRSLARAIAVAVIGGALTLGAALVIGVTTVF